MKQSSKRKNLLNNFCACEIQQFSYIVMLSTLLTFQNNCNSLSTNCLIGVSLKKIFFRNRDIEDVSTVYMIFLPKTKVDFKVDSKVDLKGRTKTSSLCHRLVFLCEFYNI